MGPSANPISVLGAALLAGSAVPTAAAGEPAGFGESVQSAKSLILTGRSADAQLLLDDLAARYPSSNDVDFLLGLLAIEGRNYERAIAHFRSILVRTPGAVRVRLELGRAFYLKRDYENAFRQFQLARAGKLPVGVDATIDRFLGAIRQEKDWSYSFGVAIAPDTNINKGSSSGEVILFGLPFELSDDTRQRSGVGLAIDGAAEFAPSIGEGMRLRLGAAMQRREYRGEDFDDTIVALHAGPKLSLGGWDLSVLATGYQRRFGGRRVSEALGAKVEAMHQLGGRTAVSIGVAAQSVRYPHHPLQGGMLFSAWGGAVRTLTPASSLTARIGVARKDARAPEYASWSGSIALGYYRDLPGGFSFYVEPGYARARYDAADPFFGQRRRDELYELRLAILNRRILVSGFTPRVGFTWARRKSTIDLYSYTQRRLEVGVTSSF